MTEQARRKPRDAEEAAALRGLGQAVTVIRERRGIERDELAAKCEMTPAELEVIEGGGVDETWGGVRLIAKALGMPLGALMIEAEEFAPGAGGERWRQNTREAEADSARSDAAEGGGRVGASSGVTEEYERRLWDELNSLLAEVVPGGATEAQAEDAILLAVMGHDSEIHALYEQVRKLARDKAGYLHERLEENNPISRVRRRLYGRWAE
jgi:transcriptional regulator with XRE-family HTH domain